MSHFKSQNFKLQVSRLAKTNLPPTPQIKDFIHPIDFRDAWGLKTYEAAEHLSLTEVSLRKYCCKTKIRTKPTKSVMRLASLQSTIWLLQGLQPIRPDLLFLEKSYHRDIDLPSTGLLLSN